MCEGGLNEVKRRHLIFSLLGALAMGGAGALAMSRTNHEEAGWEHRFLTIAELTDPEVLLVDIRTPEDWAETGVIEGAKLVSFDFNRPDAFLPQIEDDLADGRTLILICNSTKRTKKVADYLSRQISNPIISAAGGIRHVMASGYEMVAPT